MGLNDFLNKSNQRLEELVLMLQDNLTKLIRITVEALIITDVHGKFFNNLLKLATSLKLKFLVQARDIASNLKRSNITDLHDFNWMSQLRYYLVDEKIIVRMVAMSIAYDYEYLGNNGRLVITPLTERCYRTLLGAIQLNLGGAPEGPAGTGKTETSRNLAKVVAKKCMVFNCSDALDYKAMSKFFEGDYN